MLPSIPLRPPFATVAITTMQTAVLRYIFGMAKKGGHLLGNATPRLPPWLLLSAVPVGHIWLGQQLSHGAAMGHEGWVWVGTVEAVRPLSHLSCSIDGIGGRQLRGRHLS